jgi:hypothetical protein
MSKIFLFIVSAMLFVFPHNNSRQNQEIWVDAVTNKIQIGSLAGNRNLEFGVRNIIEEFLQEKDYDLNPDAKKFEKYGFEILIGSQKDEKFLEDVKKKVGKIDIVLDDGGHTYEQQIITAVSLLENIKDNGMLVVEDTHTSYMKGYGPVEYSFINYVKELIDKINHRFYLLNQKYSDNRIWSIEIFESIVALKINNKAIQAVSQKIENSRKIDGKLQDFRHVDKTKVDILKYFKKTQADNFSK